MLFILKIPYFAADNEVRRILNTRQARIRSNAPAKRILGVVGRQFEKFGFPLHEARNIIPDDDTTLFVCSGMQQLKPKFKAADGTTYGSLQSCVRTNDIDLIGDGSHLTSFVMVGNFSFKGPSYEHSVEMWTAILWELLGFRLYDCEVRVHPERPDHKKMWESRNLHVVDDPECVWSDGDIGGHCCEVFYKGLEIGNLVNPLGHSTDVGFGLERLLQVVEGKGRADETELFDQSLSPIARDHGRTLRLMRENGILPGNKGREYVCRRLLRKMMLNTLDLDAAGLWDWIRDERLLYLKRQDTARKAWKRHKDKPPEWWWDTFGIMAEEIPYLGR